MDVFNDAEVIVCADAAQWESWLAAHHEQPGGVWLKIAKKGSGTVSITIREALDQRSARYRAMLWLDR